MSFTWRLPYRTPVWKTRRRRRGKQEANPLPEVGRKSAKLDEKVLELEQLQILLSNWHKFFSEGVYKKDAQKSVKILAFSMWFEDFKLNGFQLSVPCSGRGVYVYQSELKMHQIYDADVKKNCIYSHSFITRIKSMASSW
jgi:hypothetical protein